MCQAAVCTGMEDAPGEVCEGGTVNTIKPSTHWTVVRVDLPEDSQDLTKDFAGFDSEYFVTGDTAHIFLEIEIAMVIKENIPHLILLARCPQPPFFLAKGQIISQAIPILVEIPCATKKREAVILHYMDDVLVCTPNDIILRDTLDLVVNVLTSAGFQLQEDKVQWVPPWKYLDLDMMHHCFTKIGDQQ
ncbi:hypothetical protein DUI87_08092 [Hirundo rustica rustica]|uniref:Reverse transcriptase domain-containing protein n=1 Tax=Hirundo rustica rustica TaxID=333673 RepID=A0A3M0L9G4_HIRRU|nr:hypothetical protein DUI87_08092 [Hirundo rustica rustica]